MPVHDMDDFKASSSDLSDCSELQAGVILVDVGVVADLKLLSRMVKDSIACPLANLEGLPISRINKPIDVVLEGFGSLFRNLIDKLLGVVDAFDV